jgi:hypothetical protein
LVGDIQISFLALPDLDALLANLTFTPFLGPEAMLVYC